MIFWDTTIDKIDWNKNKKAIIKRILERGNTNEIISFYGKKTISNAVKSIETRHMPAFEQNLIKHNVFVIE